MRIIIFLTFCFWGVILNAQVFDLKKPWLSPEGFFSSQFIEANEIDTIEITKSIKKDNAFFQTELPYIKFIYNSEGQLVKSEKYIILAGGIDTAIIKNSFRKDGKVYKRNESQGNFAFEYFYFFENGRISKEVKFDASKEFRDTVDTHFFDYLDEDSQQTKTTLNNSKKPYKKEVKTFNKNGKLLHIMYSFSRNQNFEKIEFKYGDNKVVEKIETEYYRSEKVNRNRYYYKNKALSAVECYEGEMLKKKYAFTYNDLGWPTAFIERNRVEKTIVIYRVNYLPFNRSLSD